MINKAKGTYDILPSEIGKWHKLEDKIRKVCSIYNYSEIRTPIFEHSETFHRDKNDTSDMVTKETYDFKDRSDRGLTLRPEGTAGVVRALIENKLYVDTPVSKLYYIGSMFRYERPQKGRNRQFNQFGVEAIGSDSPLIDAEVIALGVALIKGIGLKGVKVKINSIGDEESRNKYKEVLVNHFSEYEDDLCADCKNRLIKNPLRILDCKVDKDKPYFKEVPKISQYLNHESKKHFDTVLKALDSMGISYVVDENLVRGLDYYCHTVFELEVDVESFGAQNVIGAGGRYNGLVEQLGGPRLSGVGMAFGMERLILAMEYENKANIIPPLVHCYFIGIGDEARNSIPSLLNVCRMGGLVCEADYQNRGIKGQFKAADKLGAMFTCILGETELENSTINIKNNITDEQETIGLYEVYSYIINHLKQKSPCTSCKEGTKE